MQTFFKFTFYRVSFACKVKEWLQSLGIGDHAAVSQYEDEADDDVIPLSSEDHHSGRNR